MLDVRKAAILNAVVSEYIETAQPVGSATVLSTASSVNVSSATVRSDMAALEADGFLTQPHTSAGRVPTEKGYRYFVDSVGDVTLDRPEAIRVAHFFRKAKGEIETMMKDTATLLSGLTRYAAVVVDLSHDASPVRSIQVVDLNSRTLLVVVVLGNGQIAKQVIETSFDLTEQQLSALQQVVSECCVGHTLASIPEMAPVQDRELGALASTVRNAVADGNADADRVYVDGASKIASEFDAIESVSQVLTILEQQFLVVNLMSDVLERGMKVAIGTETGVQPLESCSVVVSPYRIDGAAAGSIAVFGPTRRHYQQTMAAVAMVSRQLGHSLSEAE